MKLEEFKILIPDEGIRNYLIETIWGEDPFSNDLNYYEIMDNIVNLAFMYAFSCYLELRNRNVEKNGKPGPLDLCLERGNANSLRVIHTFEKIYSTHPIKNELIQFVLLDIQFDFLLGNKSRLKRYFPNCITADAVQLTDYFEMINKSHNSSRSQGYTISELSDKLTQLIKSFPFLSKSSLFFDELSGWYSFKTDKTEFITDGIIHSYGVINRFKEGRRSSKFYYLASIDKEILRFENAKSLKKCSITYRIDKPNEEVIDKPYDLNYDSEILATYLNPNIQFDLLSDISANTQLYNINYKYIKHLALAISDALGLDAYKDCINVLKEAFYDSNINKKYNDNDGFVLMLLIENSPLRVLNVLIKTNQSIAFEIVLNLKMRLGNALKDRELPNDNYEFDDLFTKFIDIKNPINTKVINELKEEFVAEAKTNYILSLFAPIDSNPNFHFSKRLTQGIESLESIDINTFTKESRCKLITETLGSIIKRMMSFYGGAFGFGKFKKEYDTISEYHLPSNEEIAEYHAECLEAFVNGAKDSWEAIKNEDNLKNIIKMFIEFCKKCDQDNPSEGERGRSYESIYLYSVLGKYSIMNTEAFTNEIDVENVSDLTIDSPLEVIDWWQEKAIRIIKFFSTGSFEDSSKTDISKAFLYSIYPTLASLYRINNSRDGYDAATFFLTMDYDGNNVIDFQYEINVLSEFKYDMNKKYYCLPNISRTTGKWWVDPLLIDSELFDNIFKKE
ncbi:MAG: hypothetical protein J5666_06155 [Bacilli bacterium]|nr:hypothetical protein [Bacilli bacterium]